MTKIACGPCVDATRAAPPWYFIAGAAGVVGMRVTDKVFEGTFSHLDLTTNQALDKMGVPGVGREDLNVEVEVWLLGGYPSIVVDHGRLAMRNVNHG